MSFWRKVGKLAGKVANAGLTIGGTALLGPAGGALGGAVGKLADKALSGDNMRKTTFGDVAMGAALGGASGLTMGQAGAKALLGRVGSLAGGGAPTLAQAPGVQLMATESTRALTPAVTDAALETATQTATQAVPSLAAPVGKAAGQAAGEAAPRVGGPSAWKRIGTFAREAAPVVNPVVQGVDAILDYQQQQQLLEQQRQLMAQQQREAEQSYRDRAPFRDMALQFASGQRGQFRAGADIYAGR